MKYYAAKFGRLMIGKEGPERICDAGEVVDIKDAKHAEDLLKAQKISKTKPAKVTHKAHKREKP